VLPPDYRPYSLSRREVGPGVSRSHLISAVELGWLNTIALLFFALGKSSVNTVEIVQGLKSGDKVILSDMSAWDGVDRIRLR
jgi:hypothetical protein